MSNATYKLGKRRKYRCPCGASPRRPLQASDTEVRPFPKPCDSCGRSLNDVPFTIVDSLMDVRDMLGESGGTK